MFWIEKHENGRRLWFRDTRLHHFHFGFGLVGIGIALIARDVRDLLDAIRK